MAKSKKKAAKAAEVVLTREHFLNASAPQKFDIPAMGGVVFIKPLSAEDVVGGVENDTMILKSVCDEKGHPVFTEADLPNIKAMKAGVFVGLLKAITKLNGFSEEGIEEAQGN